MTESIEQRIERLNKPMDAKERDEMIRHAMEYIAAGIAVIPVKVDNRGDVKLPALLPGEIQPLRRESMTDQVFMHLIAQPNASNWRGLSVICGRSSGGFECIDIDSKHDETGRIWEDYSRLLEDVAPDLFGRLVIATTPSGGRHIYYKWHGEKGGTEERVLAKVKGKDQKGDDAIHALIETRRQDDLATAPPTQGREIIRGSIGGIPTISKEERDTLFQIARSLTRYEPVIERQPPPAPYERLRGDAPWDVYNERHTIEEILVAADWTVVKRSGSRTFVKHPTATTEQSGNILATQDGEILYLHTTSTGLPTSKGIGGAFAVYAWLHHLGDYKAAVRLLPDHYRNAPRKIRVRHTAIQAHDGTVLASPGQSIEVDALPGLVYFVHEKGGDRKDVRRQILEADEVGRQILIREVDTDTGEVVGTQAAGTWMADTIIEEIVEIQEQGTLTDEAIALILAETHMAVRSLKSELTRNVLINGLATWEDLHSLGWTPASIRDSLAVYARQAAENEQRGAIDKRLQALADAREQGDYDALAKEAGKIAALGSDREYAAVTWMDPVQAEQIVANRPPGLSTGWGDLDSLGVSLRPGTKNVVGARTSVGKTLFMLHMAVYNAIEHQDRVFYYVPYEEGSEAYYMRLVKHFAAQSWSPDDMQRAFQVQKALQGKGIINGDKLAKARRAVQYITRTSLRIIDSRPTLERLYTFLQGEADRGVQIGGVFIDHATIAKVTKEPEMIRERIIYVSRVCQDIAIGLDVPLVLAAQVSRAGASGDRPYMHHLKESGSLEENAEMVMMLHRPLTPEQINGTAPIPNETEMHVYIDKDRTPAHNESVTLTYNKTAQQIYGSRDVDTPLIDKYQKLKDAIEPKQTELPCE